MPLFANRAVVDRTRTPVATLPRTYGRLLLDAVPEHGELLAGGDASTLEAATASPIPMVLACPTCHERHVDEGEWATRPHKTHLCSRCGALFRPANVPTVGVAVLPEA